MSVSHQRKPHKKQRAACKDSVGKSIFLSNAQDKNILSVTVCCFFKSNFIMEPCSQAASPRLQLWTDTSVSPSSDWKQFCQFKVTSHPFRSYKSRKLSKKKKTKKKERRQLNTHANEVSTDAMESTTLLVLDGVLLPASCFLSNFLEENNIFDELLNCF